MRDAVYPRKKKRLLIEYVDETGSRQTAFTRDLSMTGFFVVAEKMPAIGKLQTLKLHLPRGIVTLEAKVVREGRGTSHVEGSAAKGFGVALASFSEEYSRLVTALEAAAPQASRP